MRILRFKRANAIIIYTRKVFFLMLDKASDGVASARRKTDTIPRPENWPEPTNRATHQPNQQNKPRYTRFLAFPLRKTAHNTLHTVTEYRNTNVAS